MNEIDFDTSKTLDQLENDVWRQPNHDSHVVTRCHQLRTVPVKDFEVEDLRIMLGQSISVRFLLPVALERLKVNPLLSGDFYSGDLLQYAIQCDKSGVLVQNLEQKIFQICADAVELAKKEAHQFVIEQIGEAAADNAMSEESYRTTYQGQFDEQMKWLLPSKVLQTFQAK